MRVTFGTYNRVTIPKELVNKFQLEQGMILDLTVEGNKMILTVGSAEDNNVTTVVDEHQEYVKQENDNNVPKHIITTKIVSNLEESKNFYRKCYSDCGLVVRTKKRYVEHACDECRGQLKETYPEIQNCPYLDNCREQIKDINKVQKDKVAILPKVEVSQIETSTATEMQTKKEMVKNKVNDINTNISKLDNIIDTEIKKKVESKQENELDSTDKIEEFLRQHKKSIKLIDKQKYFYCENCNKMINKGVKLDNILLCMECAREDFKNFMKEYNYYKKKLRGGN